MGGRWDPKAKAWFIPPVRARALFEALEEIQAAGTVWPSAQALLESLAEKWRMSAAASDADVKDPCLERLPEGLYPYQRVGVVYAIRAGGRCLIADEQGLGKTAQALATARVLGDERILIIAPGSILENWRREIRRWLGEEALIVRGRPKDPQAVLETPIIVLSYGTLGKVDTGNRDMLIVDESHYVKNPKARRTQEVLALADKFKHVLCLTGTPLLNRPAELWTQLRATLGRGCMPWWQYAKRYCGAYATGFGLDVSGASNLEELHALFRTVAVRRTKADVAKELPEVIRQTVFIGQMDITRSNFVMQIATLLERHGWSPDKVIKSLSKEARRGLMGNVFKEYADNALAKAQNPDVKSYLEDVLTQDDEKALIFGTHHILMDAVQDICTQNGVGFIRIDKDVPQQDRQRLVDRFQEDPACRVAILSFGVGREGLNMQAATRVVLAELDWSPGGISQAIARAHRIGQHMPVHAITIIASGFEDLLHAVVGQKASVVSTAIDGDLPSGERGLLEGLIREVAARHNEIRGAVLLRLRE